MTSALPVGLQYAAEITAPLPEGTSNGLIQLFGQASVVVVFLMALTRTPDGSFVPALCTLSGLLLIGGVVVSRLPEPARHLARMAVTTPTADELVSAGPLDLVDQSTSDLPRQRRKGDVSSADRPARVRPVRVRGGRTKKAAQIEKDEPTRRPPT